MRRWLAALAVLAAAPLARAADEPLVGPPPAWVLPEADLPAPPAGSQGAAIALLSRDDQLRFDAQGMAEYSAYAVKVQTASGLAAMGNVSFFERRWWQA